MSHSILILNWDHKAELLLQKANSLKRHTYGAKYA